MRACESSVLATWDATAIPFAPLRAYLFRNRLETLDLPAADHDGGARVGERKGAGATDAPAPAGDERDFPFQ